MPRKIVFYSTLSLILFVALYLPIFPDMYHLWMAENGNNSYCLLVPFVSLFLIWKKRGKITWDEAKPSNIGLFVLIVSLLSYIVGYAGGVEVLPRLTIVSTLIGLVIFNVGLNIFFAPGVSSAILSFCGTSAGFNSRTCVLSSPTQCYQHFSVYYQQPVNPGIKRGEHVVLCKYVFRSSRSLQRHSITCSLFDARSFVCLPNE